MRQLEGFISWIETQFAGKQHAIENFRLRTLSNWQAKIINTTLEGKTRKIHKRTQIPTYIHISQIILSYYGNIVLITF